MGQSRPVVLWVFWVSQWDDLSIQLAAGEGPGGCGPEIEMRDEMIQTELRGEPGRWGHEAAASCPWQTFARLCHLISSLLVTGDTGGNIAIESSARTQQYISLDIIMFQWSRTRVVSRYIASCHITTSRWIEVKSETFFLFVRPSLSGTEVHSTICSNEVLVTLSCALSSFCHLIVPSVTMPRRKVQKNALDRPN